MMLSTKPGKRPLRSLTAHEKLEAIRRVHDGESKASVARDIGVPESTLRGWCKNEEKISYISRQSSPDTDDSMHMLYEPKEKKIKLGDMDTPFNLSLKSDGLDKAMNLKSSDSSKLLSERERNRAELARISVELGLNRPEMYSTGNSLADLTSNIGLLSQWNNLLLQQATSTAAASSSKKKIAAADTSSNVITSSNNLLTTANKLNGLDLPKLDSQKSVEDSVWYWLKTHQMLGFNQQGSTSLLGNLPSSTSNNTTTNASSNSLNTLPATTSTTDQNSSWFWKWYKQYTQAAQQLQQQHQAQQAATAATTAASTTQQQSPQQSPQQPSPQILYQQLTKEAKEAKSAESPKATEPSASADNAENQNKAETQGEKPQSNTNKARAVLDNLLLNNNNVQQTNCNGKDASSGDDLSQLEALEHGEKFLKWLECCSEPSVTAMQIMQFRGLINNIKTGVDRKNGDLQKTKVRRK